MSGDLRVIGLEEPCARNLHARFYEGALNREEVKMSTRQGFNFVVGLIIVIVLHGCAAQVVEIKREDAFYKDRPEKLQLKAGLFLSDKEKNHVLRPDTWVPQSLRVKFNIGNALAVEAIESLKKVFNNVSLFNDKTSQDIDRIITIKFGPDAIISSTIVEGTPFTRHTEEFTANIELVCEVYDKNWNLLWKESLKSSSTLLQEHYPSGGAGGAYAAAEIYQSAFKRVIINTLVSLFEQLNDKILTSGKEPILRGK